MTYYTSRNLDTKHGNYFLHYKHFMRGYTVRQVLITLCIIHIVSNKSQRLFFNIRKTQLKNYFPKHHTRKIELKK
jgi:hypothetical protein